MKELTHTKNRIHARPVVPREGLRQGHHRAGLPEPKPAYNHTQVSIVRILERKGFIGHEAFGRAPLPSTALWPRRTIPRPSSAPSSATTSAIPPGPCLLLRQGPGHEPVGIEEIQGTLREDPEAKSGKEWLNWPRIS